MNKKVNEYIVGKVMDFALAGGVTGEKAHQEARLAICDTCPNKIQAKPHPTLPEVACCKLCGCTLLTKSKYIKIPRLKSRKDEPLTVSEILQIKSDKLFFEKDFFLHPISCPHKDNLWADVDNKFLLKTLKH